jgi:hypothetical protein
MPLSVGDKLGPYEILASIGAGGIGEVYRAKDTKLGREVAIKGHPRLLRAIHRGRGGPHPGGFMRCALGGEICSLRCAQSFRATRGPSSSGLLGGIHVQMLYSLVEARSSS